MNVNQKALYLLTQTDSDTANSDSEIKSDSDLDSDWESISLYNSLESQLTSSDTTDNAIVTINKKSDAKSRKKLNKKLNKKLIKNNDPNIVNFHFWHTSLLILHGTFVNDVLNDKKLQKTLKYKIPPTIRSQIRKYHRDQTTPGLIRVLGIIIRHYRQIFSLNSVGLTKANWDKDYKLNTQKYNSNIKNACKPNSTYKDLLNYYLKCAETLSGSNDIATKLFVSLLRAFHFSARLVFSLQALPYSLKEENINQENKIENEKRIKNKSNKNSIIDSTDVSQSMKNEIHFPAFWVEVLDPVQKRYFTVEPIYFSDGVFYNQDRVTRLFNPIKTSVPKKNRVSMDYIIAYSFDNSIRDITFKYNPSAILGSNRTCGRFPDKTPDSLKKYIPDFFFSNVILKLHNSFSFNFENKSNCDNLKNAHAIAELEEEKQLKQLIFKFPEKLDDYNRHPIYTTSAHIKLTSVLLPGIKPVHKFKTACALKSKSNTKRQMEVFVYKREDIVECKSKMSWMKLGRFVPEDTIPVKTIPARYVTLANIRKNNCKAYESQHGSSDERGGGTDVSNISEKDTIGLFIYSQTVLFKYPPVTYDENTKNVTIPCNSYGNIEIFTKSMIPQGGVHLQETDFPGISSLAKKLGIKNVPVLVKFDFTKKCRAKDIGKTFSIAKPIIDGILVSEVDYQNLVDKWVLEVEELEYLERIRVLHRQKQEKMIAERLTTEYGDLQ